MSFGAIFNYFALAPENKRRAHENIFQLRAVIKFYSIQVSKEIAKKNKKKHILLKTKFNIHPLTPNNLVHSGF